MRTVFERRRLVHETQRARVENFDREILKELSGSDIQKYKLFDDIRLEHAYVCANPEALGYRHSGSTESHRYRARRTNHQLPERVLATAAKPDTANDIREQNLVVAKDAMKSE